MIKKHKRLSKSAKLINFTFYLSLEAERNILTHFEDVSPANLWRNINL